MAGNSASFFFGLGLNIILAVLQITVESMPTIVAIMGYIIGGGLMVFGIMGFLRSMRRARKEKKEKNESDSRPHWPL